MDERATWARADFALIECEHHKAFDGLVEEIVVFRCNILEEDVRRLAAEFQRNRDEILAGILHDQSTRRRFAGEGDLGDARAGCERFACLKTKTIDDIDHTGGKRSPIRSMSTRIDAGVCSAGFSTTQLPAARAGASFGRHEKRKFHGMI